MNLLLQSVLEAHPRPRGSNLEIIAETVEALSVCQQVCIACSDACLAEEKLEMLRDCIRLDLECAAVCAATAGMLLRQHDTESSLLHAQLHACVIACQACNDACARHAIHHAHCALCAEACRRCQEKCNLTLGELSPAGVAFDE